MRFSIPVIATSTSVIYDNDAALFISAVGTLTNTEKDAINTLVKDLKSNSLWTKFLAIYPIVGGTSSSCKWNLKDPRDADSAYRLTFYGTPTFASTGIIFANTDTAGNTFIYPDDITSGSVHMSFYSRTNSGFETAVEMGSGNAGDSLTVLKILDQSGSTGYIAQNKGLISDFTNLPSNRSGLFTMSLVSGTTTFYRNGSSFASSSAGTVATQSSPVTIYLGAWHSNNSGSSHNVYLPTTRECAFSTIGTELSSGEVSTFYTIVQAFQTTLGRQV